MKTLEDVSSGLLFIVGCGRSGTTLLKSILDANPEVSIPPETFFFTSIVKNDGNENMSLDNKLDLLLSKWWIADARVSKIELEALLKGKDGTWNNVFLALLGALSDGEGVKVFGEKTPAHISHVVNLLDVFTTAKVIHIVRDPRAVLSSYSSVPVGTNQVSGVISEWSNAMAVHSMMGNNQRYHMLKYEDLTSNTEMEVKRICDFLEIVYTPLMLKFYERKALGYSVEQTHHKNTLSAVFNSSADAWKKKLSDTEIGMIEAYLRDYMIAHGYELTNIKVNYCEVRRMYSHVLDVLARNFIRRPKQLRKKYAALKRMNNKCS